MSIIGPFTLTDTIQVLITYSIAGKSNWDFSLFSIQNRIHWQNKLSTIYFSSPRLKNFVRVIFQIILQRARQLFQGISHVIDIATIIN